MARKDAAEEHHHGLNDVIGIVLGAAALLLMVALLSYDPRDLATNYVPPNNPLHNWAGPLGARVALILFQGFGVAAFMIPVLLLIYAMGYLLRFLNYLQRRWIWGAVLLLCCMGLASMFEKDVRLLQRLQVTLNAPSVGGYAGKFFYNYVLRFVGKAGATIVLGTVYLVSLIYLTNFKLGEWCRQMWRTRVEGKAEPPTAGEKDLERRARDLERSAGNSEIVGQVGYALGGLPGERLLHRLGIKSSDDTGVPLSLDPMRTLRS